MSSAVNTVKAAVVYGVTVRTIYNWMRRGKLRFVVKPGKHRMVLIDSLRPR